MQSLLGIEWSEAELRAWAVAENLTVSRWAERYRYLTPRQSSKPGQWRNENSPCLVGVMDLCLRQGVRKLNIKKAGQLGASEAIRNAIAKAAHQDPCPILLVLPDEKTGRKIMQKRILPLFEDTECLRPLLTAQKRDKKLTEITLRNGFVLSLGWAGSAASLASDPARIVINDEVDKMKAFTGKEADPISLGDIRTATYPNSLIVNISTPTTRAGLIHQLEEDSAVKMRFFAPCPHCGHFQEQLFDRLKWEKYPEIGEAKHRAAKIEAERAAWLECEKCGEKITDQHRPRMLNAGHWATPDGSFRIHVDGREEGKLPPNAEIGLHLSTLHSLAARHKLYTIAAEFVRCDGNPRKVQNFRNSWLGEIYEQRVSAKESNVFAERCLGAAREKQIPPWASRLVMTVDTQKLGFYWVIRAWGHGYRSRRIDHGFAQTFEDIRRIAFDTYYPYEQNAYPAQCCWVMGIDSGGGTKVAGEGGIDASRTDEVYQFSLTDRIRIIPLKGESRPKEGMAIRLRKVTYTPPDERRTPYEVWLHMVDTGWFQDLLDSRIGAKVANIDANGELLGEVDAWELNGVNDPDYNRQMASMHKVVVDQRTRKVAWVEKTSGAANHYRDCEVYQEAMAYGPARCNELPPPHVLEEQRRWEAQQAQQSASKGLRTPDGRPYLVTQR